MERVPGHLSLCILARQHAARTHTRRPTYKSRVLDDGRGTLTDGHGGRLVVLKVALVDGRGRAVRARNRTP